ncbi:MAG: hypothetical protein KJN60_05985 [Boseongicola sp.]|nr:hypothetical protein [Boseongicola sp.]
MSEDKENSPEDENANEIKGEDQTVEETDESSDDESLEASADEEEGESQPDEGENEIEDAEIVADGDTPDQESRDGDASAAAEETPPSSVPAKVEPSGPSTGGLVFGGLVAGAIGFLVATFAVPEGWPNPPAVPNDEMQAALNDQAAQIEALVAQIAELEAAPAPTAAVEVDLAPVDAEISSLAARIDALSEQMASAAARVTVLESAPAPATVPDVDFNAEMDSFRVELEAASEAARAEVEAAQLRAAEIEAEAAAAAEAARIAAELATQKAALAEVSAALESGSPFGEALEVLPDAPDALTAVADEGVPTLAALRAAFPDAARDALQAAQDVPADASTTERMAAFLRKQTNARSLSPREGDDPDAVLSRAEAALNDGDLGAALSELSGLAGEAAQSLSVWVGEAEVRAAALAAAQSLSNELN